MSVSIPVASGVAFYASRMHICEAKSSPKCPKIGSGAFLRLFTGLTLVGRIVRFLRPILFFGGLGTAEIGEPRPLRGRGSTTGPLIVCRSGAFSLGAVIRISRGLC